MNTQNPIILCVDDERANVEMLEFMLIPRGYDVVTARDGMSALAKIGSQKIDLVLLDVMMPGMDGFTVCKEIRKNEKSKNIPVIMLTAPSARPDRIRGLEAGADEFVSKPFDQAEIASRIKTLLTLRELRDNLNYAYDNITRLANVGASLINKFNPLDFDFMSKIDEIVWQMIRQSSNMIERPSLVIVRMLNEKNQDEWYRYDVFYDKIQRMPLNVNIVLGIPAGETSRLLFYNEGVLEDQMFQFFAAKIRPFNIVVNNMVCYLSKGLGVFAINYGRSVSSYDAAVLNSIVMQALFMRSLSSQVKQTEDAFEYAVHSLARASEVNDADTGKHIVRVGLYCALLGKKLKMPETFVNAIRVQAALHDVGKMHIPPSILKKPDKLTDEEWTEIKNHTIFGAKIIGDHPRLNLAKSVALTHHERWDGSGYPNGLRGENIPIESRIIAISDQYDALRNPRVYKPSFDHAKTFQILAKGDGRTMPHHFDPAVLQAFVEISSKFDEVYQSLK